MYYSLYYMYIYHTIYNHSLILCYIIYVYIIYLHTFFSSEFLSKHYTLLSELLLHNTTIYICQNCICIFLFLTLHEITICYIYILHVFKHNALSLYLTSSKLKNIIKVKISTPKFIHYRTNSKHAFYFNKTNTIKTKK